MKPDGIAKQVQPESANPQEPPKNAPGRSERKLTPEPRKYDYLRDRTVNEQGIVIDSGW